jgi:hydroxymethylbilane synthase
MDKLIRIGTRDSKLALWQAEAVAAELRARNIECVIVPVKSQGDIDLKTPLHQMGGTGIFTKVLDDSLLRGEVDIAVHSLKDYPTVAPEGIKPGGVLPREDYRDLLVYKNDLSFLEKQKALIATGSIRRKAQWLNRYPGHDHTNLRGNVQTRLQKLSDNEWNGAIFAKAGLLRLGIIPENSIELEWMIPAPAQGVVGIMCRTADRETYDVLQNINHKESWNTSIMERQFLNTLEGGCSAPIGALAIKTESGYHFKGGVFSLDGSQKVTIEDIFEGSSPKELGHAAALRVLENGGKALMKEIREKP